MLEQQWSDSTDTIKGNAEHKNVHNAGSEYRNGKYIITELSVFSRTLRLSGKCDAVEAIPCEDGVMLPFIDNPCLLFPIEYKHGKLRSEEEYEMQLCAQAMCLEEMFSLTIKSGAIFYINSHRRKGVDFDQKIRKSVKDAAFKLSEMLDTQKIPSAEKTSKCFRCSLNEICMPDVSSSVHDYMNKIKAEIWRFDE